VRVCGDEGISTTIAYQNFFKYDYNIGSQTFPSSNVHIAFTNPDLFCTINQYRVSKSSSTYVVSPITTLDVSDNQVSITSNPGIFNLWIMASTRTPINAFYAI
jgi:hypothetical protein